MPAGLQIFNSKNECVVDVTTSLCKILGTFTTDKVIGKVTVVRNLPPNTRIWVSILHVTADGSPGLGFELGHFPTIYIDNSNRTISYEYKNMEISVMWRCKYLYGVY